MKIEIGESLGYSYLRHVKQCWLVQANWKVSEHWKKRLTDEELEEAFSSMREIFDHDGSVFKGTRDCSQFLKEGEIDVVGVGQDGSIHAMEIAFHEAGLKYTGGAPKRVLKKLLRTMLILNAYHPEDTVRHIYFVSPKVHRGVQQPLAEMFESLDAEYQTINWHLLTNEEFTSQVLAPTLEKAGSVADTSELFVRSAKLLELGGAVNLQAWNQLGQPIPGIHRASSTAAGVGNRETGQRLFQDSLGGEPEQIQPLVRSLMQLLLEDYPGLLSDYDRQNLMRASYCEGSLGLQLSGYPLLRPREEGRVDGDHGRFWGKVYGGRYFVCSQWWRQHHFRNAKALLEWSEGLISRSAGQPGAAALEGCRDALRAYLKIDVPPIDRLSQPELQEPGAAYPPEVPTTDQPERRLPQLQPLVRNLMQTLLEDHPGLLSEVELQDMQSPVYCRVKLGLELDDTDVALIRRKEEGIYVNDQPKFWVKAYAGRFYVCKEWWPQHRAQNGTALLGWVEELIAKNSSHPGVRSLEWHRDALQSYLARK